MVLRARIGKDMKVHLRLGGDIQRNCVKWRERILISLRARIEIIFEESTVTLTVYRQVIIIA